MKRIATWIRLTAMLTAFVFCAEQFTYAQVPNFKALEAKSAFLQLPLTIPSKAGKIDSFHTAQGPLLVHIQTAHGHYEAQKNIEKLLAHLDRMYGIKTLLLEGASGELDPSILKFFPDSKKNYQVADAFAHAALVKGSELYLLNHDGAKGLGIENTADYRSNLESFRTVMKQAQSSEEFLSRMNTFFWNSAAKGLNKNLRRFLTEQENHASGTLTWDGWLNILKQEASYLQIDLSDVYRQGEWPMLVRYFKILELQKKTDMQALSLESRRFLKKIKVSLKFYPNIYQQVEAVLRDPAAAVSSNGDLRVLFENMMTRLPRSFDYGVYPNLNHHVGALILQNEIKGELFVSETEKLEALIVEKLASNDTEKNLAGLYSKINLLKKLFRLELTPAEYARVQASKSNPSAIAGGFNQDELSAKARSFDQTYQKALEFYAGAANRDRVMAENIERLVLSRGIQKAAVITGGFHTDYLRRYFENKGMSYAVVTPSITKIEPHSRELYLRSMMPAAFSSAASETSAESSRSHLESVFVTAGELRDAGMGWDAAKPILEMALIPLMSDKLLTKSEMARVMRQMEVLFSGETAPAAKAEEPAAVRAEARQHVTEIKKAFYPQTGMLGFQLRAEKAWSLKQDEKFNTDDVRELLRQLAPHAAHTYQSRAKIGLILLSSIRAAKQNPEIRTGEQGDHKTAARRLGLAEQDVKEILLNWKPESEDDHWIKASLFAEWFSAEILFSKRSLGEIKNDLDEIYFLYAPSERSPIKNGRRERIKSDLEAVITLWQKRSEARETWDTQQDEAGLRSLLSEAVSVGPIENYDWRSSQQVKLQFVGHKVSDAVPGRSILSRDTKPAEYLLVNQTQAESNLNQLLIKRFWRALFVAMVENGRAGQLRLTMAGEVYFDALPLRGFQNDRLFDKLLAVSYSMGILTYFSGVNDRIYDAARKPITFTARFLNEMETAGVIAPKAPVAAIQSDNPFNRAMTAMRDALKSGQPVALKVKSVKRGTVELGYLSGQAGVDAIRVGTIPVSMFGVSGVQAGSTVSLYVVSEPRPNQFNFSTLPSTVKPAAAVTDFAALRKELEAKEVGRDPNPAADKEIEVQVVSFVHKNQDSFKPIVGVNVAHRGVRGFLHFGDLTFSDENAARRGGFAAGASVKVLIESVQDETNYRAGNPDFWLKLRLPQRAEARAAISVSQEELSAVTLKTLFESRVAYESDRLKLEKIIVERKADDKTVEIVVGVPASLTVSPAVFLDAWFERKNAGMSFRQSVEEGKIIRVEFSFRSEARGVLRKLAESAILTLGTPVVMAVASIVFRDDLDVSSPAIDPLDILVGLILGAGLAVWNWFFPLDAGFKQRAIDGLAQRVASSLFVGLIPVAKTGVQPAVEIGIANIQKGIIPEIVFRGISSDTIAAISRLRKHYPDKEKYPIAAGTVQTAEQVQQAFDAGATVVISPGMFPEVIAKANELGMLAVPGVGTLQEAVEAARLGARAVKFFPTHFKGATSEDRIADFKTKMGEPMTAEMKVKFDRLIVEAKIKFAEFNPDELGRDDEFDKVGSYTALYDHLNSGSEAAITFGVPSGAASITGGYLGQILANDATSSLMVVATGLAGLSFEAMAQLRDQLRAKHVSGLANVGTTVTDLAAVEARALDFQPRSEARIPLDKAREALAQAKVMALVSVGESFEDAYALAKQIVQKGLIPEIALRGDENQRRLALKVIQTLRAEFLHSVIAAGSISSAEQAEQAVDAGADILVSPNFNYGVVLQAEKLQVLMIPGIRSVDEARRAHAAGLKIVKLFPFSIKSPSGDFQTRRAQYIEAIKAPLPKEKQGQLTESMFEDSDALPTGTPTAVYEAIESGKTDAKFSLPSKWGVDAVREIMAELPDAKAVVTGGVKPEQISDLLKDPSIAAVSASVDSVKKVADLAAASNRSEIRGIVKILLSAAVIAAASAWLVNTDFAQREFHDWSEFAKREDLGMRYRNVLSVAKMAKLAVPGQYYEIHFNAGLNDSEEMAGRAFVQAAGIEPGDYSDDVLLDAYLLAIKAYEDGIREGMSIDFASLGARNAAAQYLSQSRPELRLMTHRDLSEDLRIALSAIANKYAVSTDMAQYVKSAFELGNDRFVFSLGEFSGWPGDRQVKHSSAIYLVDLSETDRVYQFDGYSHNVADVIVGQSTSDFPLTFAVIRQDGRADIFAEPLANGTLQRPAADLAVPQNVDFRLDDKPQGTLVAAGALFLTSPDAKHGNSQVHAQLVHESGVVSVKRSEARLSDEQALLTTSEVAPVHLGGGVRRSEARKAADSGLYRSIKAALRSASTERRGR